MDFSPKCFKRNIIWIFCDYNSLTDIKLRHSETYKLLGQMVRFLLVFKVQAILKLNDRQKSDSKWLDKIYLLNNGWIRNSCLMMGNDYKKYHTSSLEESTTGQFYIIFVVAFVTFGLLLRITKLVVFCGVHSRRD